MSINHGFARFLIIDKLKLPHPNETASLSFFDKKI